jgi:hypothetical protein
MRTTWTVSENALGGTYAIGQISNQVLNLHLARLELAVQPADINIGLKREQAPTIL